MTAILIVYLSRNIPKGTLGGAEVVVVHLAQVLSRAGYQVTLLNSIASSEQERLAAFPEIKCVTLNVDVKASIASRILKRVHYYGHLPLPLDLYYNHHSQIKLRQFLQGKTYRLIISVRIEDLPLLAAAAGKIPLIQMLHGSAAWFLGTFTKGLGSGLGASLKYAAVLQVLLPSYAQTLQSVYSGKICVIPNAISQLADTEYAKIKGRRPEIVYVARYDSNKQIDVLAESFAKLAPDFPEWRCICYGTDWTPGYVQKIKTRMQAQA